jgi:hypothetical protein
MSLKNPKSIPGIPKARQKSITRLKDSIPRKKESEIEYFCSVYFKKDSATNKQSYCLRLVSTRQFTMLNYEISVKTRRQKKFIDISILGLNTKKGYVTKAGPAVTELLFKELYGKFTFNIIKQDGSINSAVFDFNIFKKQILLVKEFLPKKENNRKFCNFEVAEDKFSY